MRLLVALFAALAASYALAQAAAQEPLSMKGFQVGAAKADVLARMPAATCQPDDYCMWHVDVACAKAGDECRRALMYGGIAPEYFVAEFSDGRLVRMSVRILSAQFDELAAAMIERFGKPNTDKSGKVQNRAGATFDSRDLVWARGDGALLAVKRGNDVDHGSVTLVSQRWVKEDQDARRAGAKARAKDL